MFDYKLPISKVGFFVPDGQIKVFVKLCRNPVKALM